MFHLLELCGSVDQLVKDVSGHREAADPKELALLKSVADAVAFCFVNEEQSVEFAHQVMGMVNKAVASRRLEGISRRLPRASDWPIKTTR